MPVSLSGQLPAATATDKLKRLSTAARKVTRDSGAKATAILPRLVPHPQEDWSWNQALQSVA